MCCCLGCFIQKFRVAVLAHLFEWVRNIDITALAVLCLQDFYLLSVQTMLQTTSCTHLFGRDPQEIYSVPPLCPCHGGWGVPWSWVSGEPCSGAILAHTVCVDYLG